MTTLTEIVNQLHFIRPMVLWLLPVVLIIVWYLQRNPSKSDGWEKICDPHLLSAIRLKSAATGNKWPRLLWPIAIIAVFAIAGPAYKKQPSPIVKNQSALIIVLDVSRSMLADDIKPNRLERAKFKINDMLASRVDGQTALVVYAGDAFVVTPLTDDTETIALMLKAITPDIMPVQGSRVDIALKKSRELLTQTGSFTGEIILISDGVNSGQAQLVAEQLSEQRIYTSVLAVGTVQGAPIPTANGFVKDKAGNIVVPKLQVSALQALATAGNGRFAQISGDSTDIDFLMPSVAKIGDENRQENSLNDESYQSEKYTDEGPWLALLLVPLVLLLFRKGLLLSLFLVVGLQTPQSSYAIGWDDLWLNADQKAAKLLENEQAQAAFETAKSPSWKATAAFRQQDYATAKELFDDGSADGFYNQGNALAASGNLQQALDAYNNALAIRADDEDTLYNKKQVEQALQQQEQQQDQQQQEQENQEQQQNQDKQNQDQQQQDQEKQQQQQDSEQQQGQDNQDQGDNPEQQKQEQQQQAEMSEEEKAEQQRKQQELAQKDQQAKQEQEQEQEQEQQQQEVQLTPEELAEEAENKEAIEQWLRRIPDDPGGLLRRKFYYQYNQQNTKPDETDDW